MTNQVATIDENADAPAGQNEGSAIINMIERVASNPETGIDVLERLLQMQERVLDREARSAFARDFAAMQQDMPTIKERGQGHGKITYALWEDVNKAIRPVLTKYGFGLSFKTSHDDKQITITAILSHRDGHTEETTQSFPHDTSGSKNAIQAVGSSMTYGKRYTAGALLNLTSGDVDDDGAAATETREKVSEDQVIKLRDALLAADRDEAKFCKYLGLEKLSDIYADKYQTCIDMINKVAAKGAA